MKISIGAMLVTLCAVSAIASAKSAYDKPPPGAIVQDVPARMSASSATPWHAIASRELAGKQMGKESAYQWYLSIYAPRENGLKQVYRLPDMSGILLTRVVKARGAQMYFPAQQLKITGAAPLRQPGVEELIAWSHQTGADCGTASVAVFGAGPNERVIPEAVVTNSCDLSAEIVRGTQLASIRLTGPYYAVNAPLCCPTKPHATAFLSFTGGKWSVKPDYFRISIPPAPRR